MIKFQFIWNKTSNSQKKNDDKLQFEYPEEEEAPKPIRPASDAKGRVQDTELQKMSDQGKCLSMHQPYASLLIAGIKM